MQRASVLRDYGIPSSGFRLPETTRLGRVRLQVSDLARSAAYYEEVLGLSVGERDAQTAHLATRGDHPSTLIELHHRRGTRPVPRRGLLGLYHFAILLPHRGALGQFVEHLAGRGERFGAADHLVSEAIYLWDPDGLGIEVYADRPRDTWKASGRELAMTTERLDLPSVAAAADGEKWTGMPAGAAMGHMHLSVADLADARRFYHDALGFELTVWSYPGALFLSAGGYHHHLGTNTWAAGALKATERDARLLEWELVLPTQCDVASAEKSVRSAGYQTDQGVLIDPWGSRLRLTPTM
jgi:catechol 2,3-dioxygenase